MGWDKCCIIVTIHLWYLKLKVIIFSGDDDVDIDPLADTNTEEMDAELPNKATRKGKKIKKGHQDEDLYVYSLLFIAFI